MNYYNKPFYYLIGVLTFIISCDINSNQYIEDESSAEEPEFEANIEQLKSNGWEVTTGDVYLSQIDNEFTKGIFIFVAEKNSEQLYVNHYYIFQQKQAHIEGLQSTQKIANGATLLRGDKLLVLDFQSDEVLSYHLEYDEDSRSNKDLAKYVDRTLENVSFSADRIEVETGFGLSRNQGVDKILDISMLEERLRKNSSLFDLFISVDKFKDSFSNTLPNLQDACDESATSCSIGGCQESPTDCEITCSEGYACCSCNIFWSYATCTCIDSEGDGDDDGGGDDDDDGDGDGGGDGDDGDCDDGEEC